MVVKYIKIIVATLTLVVVGLVTTTKINAEVYSGVDYRILETGELIQINNEQYYPIVINNSNTGDQFIDIFNYMQSNTISRLEIQLPSLSSISYYSILDTETFLRNDIFNLKFTLGASGFYMKLYGLNQELVFEKRLYLDSSWKVTATHRIVTNIQGYSSLAFGGGYDEDDLDESYDNGYNDGVFTVYENGFEGIINPYTNEYYDDKDNYLYWLGVEDSNDFSFTGLLFQVFSGIGSVLTIELLPNVTLGAIVAVPIVFGIIYFILGKRKGD